jgi:trigger factor
VEDRIHSRLRNLARTVKLNGFRPGKVPFKVVQNRFQEQVQQEVVNDLIQSSLYRALADHNLRPAGTPRVEPKTHQPGEGLEYTATFEVYPEFQLTDLKGAAFRKTVSQITDADVDGMIETLRKQRVTWEEVKRKSRNDDRVVIDFTANIGGQGFDGDKGTDMAVVLGSGTVVEGFEKALTGVKPEARKRFAVTFPKDYGNAILAGKKVSFEATVKSVSSPVLPEVDEGFAKTLGVEDGQIATLRDKVRENMQRELDNALASRLKRSVFDLLVERNPITLPHALVEEESHRLAHQAQRVDQSVDPHGDHARFEAEATRRVTLGLVLSEIVKAHELTVDKNRVRAQIERIAAPFEDKEAVVKWYYSQQERLREIEAVVLEDQVAEWVLEQVKIEERPEPFDAVIKPA